ncbi:helix-turn-helix transcriptional regulator [Gordonia metallireducens]|uniref:helix-turn-helix transcriptional regulator n=1 Tax=Gordonia metallireducens TaxID=2897779 RepID=UPI0027DF181A|nr:WYL domain-containing protein [Gordonia metallireducens]
MSSMSVRLLRLLSLLQGHEEWTGAQLSQRLGVSGRTVRRDMEKLRELGYDVEATRGGIGGYRLGHGGNKLPPLLLDTDEAVAVAVGLRTGVNCIIGGMEETSLRALTKLEGTLPDWLRQHVRDLSHFMVPLPHEEPIPITDPTRLTTLAEACRRHERFRFTYDPDDLTTHDVEPYRLVNRGHRWYLLGYDVGKTDWELFAVEQIAPRNPHFGPRFAERALPADDIAVYVGNRLREPHWAHRASVILHAGADEVAGKVAPAEGTISPIDDENCRAILGGQSLTGVAATLTRLDVDFEVERPAELVEHLGVLADRYARAGHR